MGEPSARTISGGSWPALATHRCPVRTSRRAHRAVMNSDERRSSTRIRFVRSSACGRPGRVVDRRVQQRPRERHEQGGRDALAGDIGDDDAQRPPAPAQAEQVEEVAADLASRLVVAGDIEPGDVRGDERDEAALEAPTVGQLLIDQSSMGCRAGRGLGVMGGHGREGGGQRRRDGLAERRIRGVAPGADPATGQEPVGDLAG